MIKVKNMESAKVIADECTGCNLCMKNCTMLQHYCESPKALFSEIRDTEEVDRKVIYSCTGCDYCNHVCPKGLDIKNFCYEMKRQCVQDNASVNKSGQLTVLNYHKASTHPVFTYLDKDIKNGDAEVAFMPGCSLASTKPKVIKRILDKMNTIEPVGLFVDCCGNPVYGVGDNERFEENKRRVSSLLKENGVKKLVTACGNCYKTFAEFYDVEVVDLWHYMATHQEIFVKEPSIGRLKESYILHDPCSFRKNEHAHDSVRLLIEKMGIEVNEFETNRGNSACCGAGGMMSAMVPHIANQGRKSIVGKAGKYKIISYCQCCVEGFRQQGNDGSHILELLFPEESVPKKMSTIKRWLNRWIAGNTMKL